MSKKLYSKVWTLFTLSEDKEIAQCNECGKKVSFRGHTIGNLYRHYRRLHPTNEAGKSINNDSKEDIDQEENLNATGEGCVENAKENLNATGEGCVENTKENLNETGEGVSDETPRKNWSSVWHFYTLIQKNKRAMCNFCDKVVSYSGGSTGNLKRHIRLKHDKEHKDAIASGRKPEPSSIPSPSRNLKFNEATLLKDIKELSTLVKRSGCADIFSKPKKKKLDTIIFDLCIIGAGLYGSSAARHVSVNPTVKVCLINTEYPKEEDFTGREIFYANVDEGSVIHSTGSTEIYQVLSRESVESFRELEKLSGIKFYHSSGTLAMFDEIQDESLAQNISYLKNSHCLDLSSNNSLSIRYPFMKVKNETNKCIYLDDIGAGYINPRKMIWAQNKVSQVQGCKIICDTAEILDPLDGVNRISTGCHGEVKAKRILLCPVSLTGIKNFHVTEKLKMTWRKKTSVLVKISEEEAERLNSMPAIVIHSRGSEHFLDLSSAYILPPMKYLDGMNYLKIDHLREVINSENSEDNVEEDSEFSVVTENGEFYYEMLKDIFPDLQIEEIKQKNSISFHSSSGIPYIDRLTPTISIAAVENSKSTTICEEVGRLAAELCITGKWDSKISKYLFKVK